MIKRHFLQFEKPLEEISDKIEALEIVSKDNPELRSQIDKLQLEFDDRTKKIYSNPVSYTHLTLPTNQCV